MTLPRIQSQPRYQVTPANGWEARLTALENRIQTTDEVVLGYAKKVKELEAEKLGYEKELEEIQSIITGSNTQNQATSQQYAALGDRIASLRKALEERMSRADGERQGLIARAKEAWETARENRQHRLKEWTPLKNLVDRLGNLVMSILWWIVGIGLMLLFVIFVFGVIAAIIMGKIAKYKKQLAEMVI